MKDRNPTSVGSSRLRRRIFLLFLAGGLIIVTLTNAVVYYRLSRAILSGIEADGKASMQLLEKQVRLFIDAETARLEHVHQFYQGDPGSALRFIALEDRFEVITIVNPEGLVLDSTEPLRKGYRYKGMTLFEKALAGGMPLFDISFHPFESRLLINLVLPVRDRNGKLDYLAFHQMKPGIMESALASLLDQYDRDLVVFDPKGIIFFKLLQVPESYNSPKPFSLFDFGMDVTRLDKGFETVQRSMDDSWLITIKKMDSFDGYIAARSSLETLRTSLRDMLYISLALFIFTILVFVLLGMILSRQILFPILELSGQVRDIVAAKRESISIPPSELSIIADAFNHAWTENISIRKGLELEKHEAEEANRTKSRFLANMSHEMRTPMNAIIGFAHLALNDYPDSPAAGPLRKIHKAADSLLVLIDDILDIAKLEANTFRLAPRAFNLKTLLYDAHELFTEEAARRGLEFTLVVDTELPDRVVGDGPRIRQILVNLLGNAVKFTDSGSIGLKVAVLSRDGDSCELEFKVSDTGRGISPDVVGKLFSPFFQADSSSVRKFGGSGLGLSIARNLAVQMGGNLELLSSEPGVGTTFRCILRLDVDRGTEQSTIEESQQRIPTIAEACDGNETRILLVEDNLTNRELALSILKRACLSVDIAGDGSEAVLKVSEHRYGAVLMDIQMPVMDGYEATTRIRAMADPVKARIPIIAMTADTFPEDRDRCLKVGMDDYISKPYRPKELISKLAKVLGVELTIPTTAKGPTLSGETQPVAVDNAVSVDNALSVDNGHFSFSQGLRMVNGNMDTYLRILRSFLEDSGDMIPMVGRALEKGDVATARRSIHTLKGISGTVGAPLLSGLCKRIEQDFNAGRSSMEGIVLLREEFEVVCGMMRDVLVKAEASVVPGNGQHPDARPLSNILADIQADLGTDTLVPDSLIDELEYAFAQNGRVPEALTHLVAALKGYDYPRSRKLMEAPNLIDPRIDAGA